MGVYLDAGYVGKWFALLLLSLPAALALLKSIKAPTTALRLGCLSLFCGLTMLVWPETVIESLTLGISAWARLALGLSGVATAVLALVRSRKEEGVGRAAPWWGGALSVLHLVMAVG